MNEMYFRIMGIHTKMKKNTKMSKTMKAFAVVSVFYSFCYGLGAANIPGDKNIDAKVVWILSMVALIASYFIDSNYIKTNKACEFEIYKLEVEDLKDKKEIAEITGEILPDYVLNKEIDKPTEDVLLPTVYYSVLLVIDIVIRIWGGL